ncbi:hypothetical protein CN984_17720 [Bacillus cereus]|uniref:Uncharacterized protein n=1 Tax=Bacillus cereus TaxID=1396 RepID=A0A2B9PUN3_BACCE|nr:hypothetical protein [Bacillus cereus]PFI96897.1 hypothetical protein COI88_28135 [Bacillus cereus]PGO26407.1 hypothetical protein CN984_17720 [Bacillus cereus]
MEILEGLEADINRLNHWMRFILFPIKLKSCPEFSHIPNFNELVFQLRYYLPSKNPKDKRLAITPGKDFKNLMEQDQRTLIDLINNNEKQLIQQIKELPLYRFGFVTGAWK